MSLAMTGNLRQNISGALAVVMLTVVSFCAGCVETSVTYKKKPILAGLPGTGGGGSFRLPTQEEVDRNELFEHLAELRTINPDGSVTLRSPTVRDLMRHILETLMAGDEDAFTEQLLSRQTRHEFVEHGFDPREAFRELERRRDDIRQLFQAMPAGEFTPGVLMQPVGRNVFRLNAGMDPSMRWTYMDVVFDKGDYKLRWFGR